MRIVLVSADQEAKALVADQLQSELGAAHFIESIGEPDRNEFLLDYREATSLLANRAIAYEPENSIRVDSLIDSLAYISTRLADIATNDNTNTREMDRWFNVLTLAITMIEDGYKVDHTLYIPYTGEDENWKDLDRALRDTLDVFEIPFREIDPNGEVAKWVTS